MFQDNREIRRRAIEKEGSYREQGQPTGTINWPTSLGTATRLRNA